MRIGITVAGAVIVTACIVYVSAVYPAHPPRDPDLIGSSVGKDTCKVFLDESMKDRYLTYVAGFSDAQRNPARRPSAAIASDAARAAGEYCAGHESATVTEALRAHFDGAPQT